MTAKTPSPRPGYSDEQLQKGRAARLDGASWTKVAETAGVKSENYFSRVLRERFPELAVKPAPAKEAEPKKPAKKATTRRVKTAAKK